MEDDKELVTQTTVQQKSLEKVIGKIYGAFLERSISWDDLALHRDQHIEFLLKGLQHLGSSYTCLDASRTWLCYWIIHSLALLGEWLESHLADRCIDFLSRCQDADGGFAGGPGQLPHLAPTYAAVCVLVTIGGQKAYSVINRKKMLNFLLRMKTPSGGFRMHENGEIDMRGCYTALAVAHMLNILTPELKDNVAMYISSCQTYEGGIGGEPGNEAHGGYTFCGFAALILADAVDAIDLPSLVDWAVFRQGIVEGGFQGRTNKLVDGCYSYWQGGLFLLLQRVIRQPQANGPYEFEEGVEKPFEEGDNNPPQCEMDPSSVFETPCGSPHFEEAVECRRNNDPVASCCESGKGSVLNQGGDVVHMTCSESAENISEKGKKIIDEEAGNSAERVTNSVREDIRAEQEEALSAEENEESLWSEVGVEFREIISDEDVDDEDDAYMDDSDDEEAHQRRLNAVPFVKAVELFACLDGAEGLAEGLVEGLADDGGWVEGIEGGGGGRGRGMMADDGLSWHNKDALERLDVLERGGEAEAGNCSSKSQLEGRDGDEGSSSPLVDRNGNDRNGNGAAGPSDACAETYTDWQGLGVEALSIALLDTRALQGYVLLCCQAMDGGLRDKPGKGKDYYHTCYCLSGLSAAQRCGTRLIGAAPPPTHVVGPYSNLLEPADPLCNVHLQRYREACQYFRSRPLESDME